MRREKIRAVYKIENVVNYKVYVGSSENYYNRMYKHKSDLRANSHCNDYLQKAWNKYGEHNFKFEILEIISIEDNIIEKEQYWIDILNVSDRNIGYNLKLKAYSNLGYKYSIESKAKMSNAKKGKTWTIKQRNVLSNIIRSKRPHCRGVNNVLSKAILQYDLDNNFIKEWESINICSKELGLHPSNMVVCLQGKIKQTGGFIFKYK